GLGVHEGAAAGREDLRPVAQQALDDFFLAVTERGLAEPFEDVLDGAAGRFDDLGIGIDERYVEAAGQPLADARFSHAHQTNQDDRAARTGFRRHAAAPPADFREAR